MTIKLKSILFANEVENAYFAAFLLERNHPIFVLGSKVSQKHLCSCPYLEFLIRGIFWWKLETKKINDTIILSSMQVCGLHMDANFKYYKMTKNMNHHSLQLMQVSNGKTKPISYVIILDILHSSSWFRENSIIFMIILSSLIMKVYEIYIKLKYIP